MRSLADKYRVLYFIRDSVPTEAERIDAVQYGPNCAFRNAAYGDTGAPEDCSAVAGAVPATYADLFPAAIPWMKWLDGAAAPAAETPPPPPPPFPAQPPASLPVTAAPPSGKVAGKPAGWNKNAG